MPEVGDSCQLIVHMQSEILSLCFTASRFLVCFISVMVIGARNPPVPFSLPSRVASFGRTFIHHRGQTASGLPSSMKPHCHTRR